MKKESLLTTKKFAEAMQINYRTALRWLRDGEVPGARRIESLVGEHWEIPASALKMKRPRKRGLKPLTEEESNA